MSRLVVAVQASNAEFHSAVPQIFNLPRQGYSRIIQTNADWKSAIQQSETLRCVALDSAQVHEIT
jgi:hypothetical protein